MARRIPNQYTILDNGEATLLITKEDGTQYVVLISAEDVPLLKSRSWHIRTTYVAGHPEAYPFPSTTYRSTTRAGNVTDAKMTISQFLLNTPKGLIGHHINGNALDCRRSNIETANAGKVQRDRPACESRHGQYIVEYRPSRFRVQSPRRHGKSVCVGTYSTIEEAVLARDKYFAEHGIPLRREAK